MYGLVQRWCEQRHMGFKVDGYTFVVNHTDVKTLA
jgi:hypothetical protein